LEVKFEYLGEDQDFPDAKTWKVEAIHVMTTRNKRKFTREELAMAGRSLAFRPLNINHDTSRALPFPENATLDMDFDPTMMAVVGRFRVLDPTVNAMIETARITKVSIEQIPTKGETCNQILCEQHGVAFIGLALLENDVEPGDNHADIHKSESVKILSLSEMVVSNDQRVCLECSDFVPCHSCQHKVEAGDDCMSDKIREVKAAHPDMDRDQVIAIALSKCGLSRNSESAWWWYGRAKEYWKGYTTPVPRVR